MQPIVLSPTQQPPIEFDGELLLSVDGQDADGQTGGRWHDISVYRTGSGELAVEISYRTTAAGELEHRSVEMAQDVSDVDATLSLYDPKELVVQEPGPARTRLVDVLVRRYDVAVNDILSRLQDVSTTPDTPTKPR
ncbi:MAG: hypothetical protein HQ518_17400 [Rhodopirellula sp.]|nr:hypothetical protein [Rhodopirellula sp.]